MAIFNSFLYVYQRVIGLVFAEARTSPEEIFQEFISKYGGAGTRVYSMVPGRTPSTKNDVGFHLSEAETHVKQAFVPQKSI